MPEILPDHVPSPRTLLAWDGTAYRAVLVGSSGRLHVRGMNQLFSLKSVLAFRTSGVVSGAGGYLLSGAVPAGEYWVVTTICAFDVTSPTTRMLFQNVHDGTTVVVFEEIRAFAASDRCCWGGMTVLDVGDVIRVSYIGALAGDTCYIDITGYRMTVEV